MPRLSRRSLLSALSLVSLGASGGWFRSLAAEVREAKARKRQCILLWMTGGPSQLDTFDMKPGHANGGEFKEVATSVPGLKISEHLPKLAQQAQHLTIVRSLATKEGDHGRGTYLVRTGHPPQGPIQYPNIGAALAKELGNDAAAAPQNVAISPYRIFNQAAFGAGFLGPRYAPLTVGATDNLRPQPMGNAYADLKVDDLTPPTGVSPEQYVARKQLWKSLQTDFLASHRQPVAVAHQTVFERALSLMDSDIVEGFDLTREADSVRDRYGRGRFGQGCLLARRLVERGVPFVEVSLGAIADGGAGWDTHQDNFRAVKALSTELDNGWGTLLAELHDRGLLETTTILWIGEFGRTPKINPQGGRDHFPQAWSCVLAGGGIRGGQAYGKTSASGEEVEDGKAGIGDILATVCRAVGVDPETKNISDQGRPIKVAEGTPIADVLSDSA